ncbi:MAG: DUF4340 domain-containing protein [Sphaerospermopsis sp. SIO1G1]|nr:DUF4340 domain-containing protein [Sphaerospermopsis sp. SIO1G1]
MKKTTLILIVLALGLGTFVYFTETRVTNKQEEVKQTKVKLFDFTADDVQFLSIQTKEMTVNIERSDKSEPPKWLLKLPVDEVANDAIVSYLMDLLVGKGEKISSPNNDQMSEFGLDKPFATINIKLKNENSYQLTLGKSNFNESLLYAQVGTGDDNNEKKAVFLVSKDFANAVNRELSEWQVVSKKENENVKSTPLPGLPESMNEKKE